MLTVGDVSKTLGVSLNTVRNLIESGNLPAINIAPGQHQKTYRVKETDLNTFMERRSTLNVEIRLYQNTHDNTEVNCSECGKEVERRNAFTFAAISIIPGIAESHLVGKNMAASETFTCSVECLRASAQRFAGEYIEGLVNKYLLKNQSVNTSDILSQ